MKPTPPTVRAVDADGSEFWMDARGRAWRADSSRVPELDGPAAVADAVSVSDTARALAGLHAAAGAKVTGLGERADRIRMLTRRAAIEDCARACGPQVYAAFSALLTGDATRAPGVGHA